MSRCKTLLGALTVLSIVSVSILSLSAALAQQPPGGRVLLPGVQTFGSPVDLLRGPQVRKELAISDEQTRQIEEAFAPALELRGNFREAQNLSYEDRQELLQKMGKKVAAVSKLVEDKVHGILNPEQRTRLKQLWLQFQGTRLFIQPEVAKELGLTQEQQDKIGKILKVVQIHRQRAGNPPRGQPGFQDFSTAELEQWRSELRVLEEKAEVDTLAVLTDEQKANFAKMKGKEFAFAFLKGRTKAPARQRPPLAEDLPAHSTLDRPGPRFGNSIELLRIPEIRKELALSDEQMKQLEEAYEPLNALAADQREAQGLSPDDRRQRFEEISKKGGEESKVEEEKVGRILTPEQLRRFKELVLQSAGPMALRRPDVVKQLDLTQEQQDRIQQCMQPVRDHLRLAAARPEPGQPNLKDFSEAEREQWRTDLHKLQEKAQADMLAVLSDEQRTKFADMTGKKFEFPYGRGLGASAGGKLRQPADK